MTRIALFFLLALGAFGCKKKEEIPHPPTTVTAFLAEAKDIPAEFEFVGVAKSSHPVEIRARVEGYLTSIDYAEGKMVEDNELLFQLDPSQFINSVDEAKGELARQEAILWRAERALARIEPLYEKNASSLRDLDNVTAQVLAAEASVISAKANLEQALLNLSYTQITSPIKGMAGRALFREGTLITPSVNGLLTLVSVIDPIWVYFSISEIEILQGRVESKDKTLVLPEQEDYTVRLRLANERFFPYTGKVNFAAPTLDPQTGTLMVRATFPNPEGELLPGEFVRAYVVGGVRPDAIFVPQRSVFQGKDGRYVFVIETDYKVKLQHVEVGPWYKDYWVITQGLHPGEIVVVDGVNKLQDGSEVQITKLYSAENTEL